MPLLVPSPNQKNVHGENREKWVINPSSKSPRHREMFVFFGALLGYGFVNGESCLDLDLPLFFWKKLKRQAVAEADIEEIDAYSL